jgi:hypothetical protein
MTRRVLGPLVAIAVLTSSAVPGRATVSNSPGWLGSRSALVAQNVSARIAVPSAFANADLLVALVASDGPDTYPNSTIRTATTAVFGGTTRLHWTRVAHISARQDWAAPGGRLEQFGASVAEVWIASTTGWNAAGTITVTTTHPESHDDGMAVTVAAFANGRFDRAVTFDGLAGMPEHVSVNVPADSALYAATFEGKVNADFAAVAGSHRAAVRRAGDDTAGIIATNSRDLPGGPVEIGNASPDPGNYWEAAVAVVTARPA